MPISIAGMREPFGISSWKYEKGEGKQTQSPLNPKERNSIEKKLDTHSSSLEAKTIKDSECLASKPQWDPTLDSHKFLG